MGRRVKKLPDFVHGYIDVRGKPRHYLRRPGRKNVPLPGLPWSAEMMEARAAALNDSAPVIIGAKRSVPGTVAEAVARYLGSHWFTDKSAFAPATQAMRRAILQRFRDEHGDKRLAKLQAEHVGKLLSRLAPYAQRNWLKTLRGLMAFAVAERLIDVDPTIGVKPVKVKDSGGHETWTGRDIEQYRSDHALGTRSRLAIELLYNTMSRRGDVVQLGRQHVRETKDGPMLSFRSEKNATPVDIPVLPELQAALDAMPKAEHLTFLVTEFGKPFTAAGFGGWFRDQCDLAGLPKLSAHGLRKAGAVRLAEHGCNDHEIMAWGGWKTLKEVQRYTKAVNLTRLTQQAARRLKAGTELANIPTPLANRGEKA